MTTNNQQSTQCEEYDNFPTKKCEGCQYKDFIDGMLMCTKQTQGGDDNA